ncbi:hypothetical protein [Roseibium alexandrii]
MFVGLDGSGGNPNPGDPVGLVLNKAGMGGQTAEAYIARLPNLAGTVDSENSWTQVGSNGAGTITFGSKITLNNVGGDNAVLQQDLVDVQPGDWVRLKIVIASNQTSLSGFQVQLRDSDTPNTVDEYISQPSANHIGEWTLFRKFEGTGNLMIWAVVNGSQTDLSVSLSDVEYHRIPGEHLKAPSTNQKPVLRKWPLTDRRNLHPYSGVATLSSSGMLNPSNTNGVSSSLVGSGEENGLPYIDVRFQGTTTNVFHVAYFEIFFGTSVSGQTITQSVYTKLVGGTTDNITAIKHRCEPSATTVFDNVSLSLTEELVRTEQTGTAVNNNTNNSYGIALTFPSGVAIDITIRIAAPQIEVGTTPTPYQAVYNENHIEEAGVPSVYSLVFEVDDGLQFGGVPINTGLSIFLGLNPDDAHYIPISQSAAQWVAFRENEHTQLISPDWSTLGPSVFVNGEDAGSTRASGWSAVPQKTFSVVEYKDVSTPNSNGWELGYFPNSAIWNLNGQISGLTMIPTSAMTNAMRRVTETLMNKQAGIQ